MESCMFPGCLTHGICLFALRVSRLSACEGEKLGLPWLQTRLIDISPRASSLAAIRHC